MTSDELHSIHDNELEDQTESSAAEASQSQMTKEKEHTPEPRSQGSGDVDQSKPSKTQAKGPKFAKSGFSKDSAAIERIYKRLDALNPILAENEGLKLKTLDEDINRSYYDSWNREANKTFRLMVTFSKRVRHMKKGLRSH